MKEAYTREGMVPPVRQTTTIAVFSGFHARSHGLRKAEGPVTTDALLSRVFSLVMHPDKNRRLGGLMAFNQLCRPLREETSLVDR